MNYNSSYPYNKLYFTDIQLVFETLLKVSMSHFGQGFSTLRFRVELKRSGTK